MGKSLPCHRIDGSFLLSSKEISPFCIFLQWRHLSRSTGFWFPWSNGENLCFAVLFGTLGWVRWGLEGDVRAALLLFSPFNLIPSYPVWNQSEMENDFNSKTHPIRFFSLCVLPIAPLLSQQALSNNEPVNTRFVSLLQASRYSNTISQHWLICFIKANGGDSWICLFGCTNLLHSLTHLLQQWQFLLISCLPFGWEAACYICKIHTFHRRYPACLCKGNNVKWSFLFNTNLFHLTLESEMRYGVSTQNRSL